MEKQSEKIRAMMKNAVMNSDHYLLFKTDDPRKFLSYGSIYPHEIVDKFLRGCRPVEITGDLVTRSLAEAEKRKVEDALKRLEKAEELIETLCLYGAYKNVDW